MKRALSLAVASIFLCACSTTQIEKSLPYVRPAVALAASGVLLLGTNDSDRTDIAGDIYAIAVVVESLSGGETPSPDALQNAIKLATPKSKEWTVLATTISGIYAGVYPNIKGNAGLTLQILTEISLGCEDAASSWRKPAA